MLIIEPGRIQSLKMGASKDEIKEKIQSLMDLFTSYPNKIEVHNRTKTCNVTLHVVNNTFQITITNPDDEIFHL